MQPLLVTLLFQACVGETLPDAVHDTVKLVLSAVNSWVAYKIARQAARYGHHAVAAEIFGVLQEQVRVAS